MSGYQVDTAKLRQHADEFPDLADRMSGVHRDLASALDQAGDCWGDDPVGRSFAGTHLRAAARTLDQLGALPGRITDVGDRLHRTATAYDQVEQANVESLTD
jgi:uncharacterized protein YukE